MAESYRLLLELDRLDGIIYVGRDLGRLLTRRGDHQQARVVLERSRDGLVRLGRTDEAAQVQSMLDSLRDPGAEDS